MADDVKSGPGKLALAILGSRPKGPSESEPDGDEADDVDPTSATMDSAAGELMEAITAGDRAGVVAAFEAMFQAKMGSDTTDEEV